MDSQQTNNGSNSEQLSDKQTDELLALAKQPSEQQSAPSEQQPAPSNGQTDGPSSKQLDLAEILSWIITTALAAGIVLLLTNNPWGGFITAVLGLIGQQFFEKFPKKLEKWIKTQKIEKWAKSHFTTVKVLIPIIGTITVFIMLFDIALLAGWVHTNFPWQQPTPTARPTTIVSPSPPATYPPSLTPTPTDIISVTTRDGSQVGVSDGRYVFDMGLSDNVVKKQAAAAVSAQRYDDAQAILKEAINLDPTDAEARIYEEDARIRASGSPYITLIVVTTFKTTESKDRHNAGASRDILQGACLAQITHNSTNPSKQVLLLIANAPDPLIDASTAATQITQAARQDPTIVGVIGWPSGSDDAIEALGKAHIPVVSPTSLNISSGAGGYFFSVAPSIDDLTKAATLYAQSHWKVNKAAVFYDPGDPHSTDLYTAFVNNFQQAGGTIISKETYSTDSPEELTDSAKSLIAAYPDLKFFYFAGYPADARQLLQNIHGIHVMAGDSLYQMVHCPVSICPVGSLSGLYFTAPAFQDENKLLQSGQQKTWLQLNSTDFFTAYQQQFNTGNAGNPYDNGGRISSDVMLAYDATSALLYASQHANGQISAQTIRQGLQSIQNVYGVSGHLSFGSDGYPQQKAVLILWPSANGTKLQSVPPPLGYY